MTTNDGGENSNEPIAYNQCQEAVQKLTEYLSHELPPDAEAKVQDHLQKCRGCFAKFQFEEHLLRTIRERVESVRAPGALREKILGLLSQPAADAANRQTP